MFLLEGCETLSWDTCLDVSGDSSTGDRAATAGDSTPAVASMPIFASLFIPQDSHSREEDLIEDTLDPIGIPQSLCAFRLLLLLLPPVVGEAAVGSKPMNLGGGGGGESFDAELGVRLSTCEKNC